MESDKKHYPNTCEIPLDPKSLKEFEDIAEKRISFINDEFTRGFEFLRNNSSKKSVTIFGSARFNERNKHYEIAYSVAKKLAMNNYTIVTGGGPGIMEAGNRGAKDAGGKSLGMAIKLFHEQIINDYTTASMQFYYFFTRKVVMSYAAEAYIFFPGGYGTLNEFFETITLVQTKKIPSVPMVLMGSDYWNPLKDYINQTLYHEHRAIDESDKDLFTITDDEEKAIEIVKNSPVIHNIDFKLPFVKE